MINKHNKETKKYISALNTRLVQAQDYAEKMARRLEDIHNNLMYLDDRYEIGRSTCWSLETWKDLPIEDQKKGALLFLTLGAINDQRGDVKVELHISYEDGQEIIETLKPKYSKKEDCYGPDCWA